MLRFIVRRLLVTIPMIWIVVSATWLLIRIAPGNFYTGERVLSPAIEKNLREKYGLNQPFYVQYGKMMSNIARGDFGTSLKYEGQSVNDILKQTLPVSATVGLFAYLLALGVGILLGTIGAVRQNSTSDYASMTLALFGISVPNFVLGPILVLFFSLTYYWFPPARWEGFPSRSAVLPILTLSAIYMAYIARLTRSGMLEVLRADYVRTARAKGLREKTIVMRHVLRGGLLPVLSFSGPALAFLLTGTIVVEKIFALPGMGNYFINANLNRDEPLIIGIVAFTSIAILIFNLMVDVAYSFVDPRIRLDT
jgi:oligopeptide transport system permease protein